MKAILNDLETNIRDLYRSVYEFKKHYQPRTNLVRDEKCNLFAEFQRTRNR